MNKSAEAKNANDDLAILNEEINDAIKTIRANATWMLGILVALILGLASFISRDFGGELEIGSIIWFIWITAVSLCLFYIILLVAYIYPLIAPNYDGLIERSKGAKPNQESINESAERLSGLVKNFKRLIFLFVISVPTSLTIGVGFLALHYLI